MELTYANLPFKEYVRLIIALNRKNCLSKSIGREEIMDYKELAAFIKIEE